MNQYRFIPIFNYTEQLIWDKFQYIPDETTVSDRNGFVIVWDNKTLEVYPLHIYNMIIIEYKNEHGKREYHTSHNMDELYNDITLLINRIKPNKLF